MEPNIDLSSTSDPLFDSPRKRFNATVVLLAGTLVASTAGAAIGWMNHVDHQSCEHAKEPVCSVLITDESRSTKEIRDELERNRNILVENGYQLSEFLEMLEHVKHSAPRQPICVIPCLLEVARITSQLSRLTGAPAQAAKLQLKEQRELCQKLAKITYDPYR
jgi:hypothetical protein